MIGDLAGLVVSTAPVVGLLLWRQHVDARQRAGDIVRAEIHAGATRALEGESLLAIQVRGATPWRQGEVRLSAPGGYESLLGEAWPAVISRLPTGYELVIHCGGGA